MGPVLRERLKLILISKEIVGKVRKCLKRRGLGELLYLESCLLGMILGCESCPLFWRHKATCLSSSAVYPSAISKLHVKPLASSSHYSIFFSSEP